MWEGFQKNTWENLQFPIREEDVAVGRAQKILCIACSIIVSIIKILGFGMNSLMQDVIPSFNNAMKLYLYGSSFWYYEIIIMY